MRKIEGIQEKKDAIAYAILDFVMYSEFPGINESYVEELKELYAILSNPSNYGIFDSDDFSEDKKDSIIYILVELCYYNAKGYMGEHEIQDLKQMYDALTELQKKYNSEKTLRKAS